MNKNLKVAALFVGFSLLLSACGSSGGNTKTPPGGGITPPPSNFGSTYSENVTVLNWTYGADSFTDGPLSVNLDATGKGTITLANEATPHTQDHSLAADLASGLSCPTSSLTTTGDSNVYDGSYDFYATDSAKNYVYVVDLATADTTFNPTKRSTSHSAGGKDGDFYFVTQDFTLKGTAACDGGVQTTFDVTLTPGWNLVTYTDVDGTNWTVKNDVEAGMQWRALPFEKSGSSIKAPVSGQSVHSTMNSHRSSN